MSELLRELVGLEVSVWWPSTASSQVGVVKAIIGGWLQLDLGEFEPTGRYLLLPLRTIRLIKCAGHGLMAVSATGGLVPELVGGDVIVESSITGEGSYKDKGVLEAFDADWLRVRAGKNQLLFGVSKVVQVQVR